MPYEVEPEFECSFAIGYSRCRQTASGYVQRDIPPVVQVRRQAQPDLTNYLSPHMECCIRVFPRTQRQSGPAFRLIGCMNHSHLIDVLLDSFTGGMRLFSSPPREQTRFD